MASIDKEGIAELWKTTKSYVNGRLEGVATTFDYDVITEAEVPPMPVSQGGTGATTPKNALSNLGIVEYPVKIENVNGWECITYNTGKKTAEMIDNILTVSDFSQTGSLFISLVDYAVAPANFFTSYKKVEIDSSSGLGWVTSASVQDDIVKITLLSPLDTTYTQFISAKIIGE